MRAIGYVRVSTIDQANEGVSLDAQRARIEAWCRSNDATLAEGDVFVDAGLSGKKASNRPALQRALDSVCKGGGVLVVYSLSRLARSVRDTLAIAERLERSGADLASVSERIDTVSAAGKMLFRLLAVLAEFERDLISERTLTALAYKRSKGERCGQLPYGRGLAGDGKTLTVDAAERQALADIKRWRSAGCSLRVIAARLTDAGIPPKNGGSSWSHTSVAHLLKEKPHAKNRAKADPPDRPTLLEPSA
jgi:DNA invertase Pin-like site-specific DNA recombinase